MLLSILAGYGNIAPKTLWGRWVTILYAIPGIPLFLLWVAQMGDLLGTSYKVIYYNVCCGLCRRGKRRKALALASKTKKLEDKEKSMAASEVGEEAKNCLLAIQNMAVWVVEFSSGGTKLERFLPMNQHT